MLTRKIVRSSYELAKVFRSVIIGVVISCLHDSEPIFSSLICSRSGRPWCKHPKRTLAVRRFSFCNLLVSLS